MVRKGKSGGLNLPGQKRVANSEAWRTAWSFKLSDGTTLLPDTPMNDARFRQLNQSGDLRRIANELNRRHMPRIQLGFPGSSFVVSPITEASTGELLSRKAQMGERAIRGLQQQAYEGAVRNQEDYQKETPTWVSGLVSGVNTINALGELLPGPFGKVAQVYNQLVGPIDISNPEREARLMGNVERTARALQEPIVVGERVGDVMARQRMQGAGGTRTALAKWMKANGYAWLWRDYMLSADRGLTMEEFGRTSNAHNALYQIMKVLDDKVGTTADERMAMLRRTPAMLESASKLDYTAKRRTEGVRPAEAEAAPAPAAAAASAAPAPAAAAPAAAAPASDKGKVAFEPMMVKPKGGKRIRILKGAGPGKASPLEKFVMRKGLYMSRRPTREELEEQVRAANDRVQALKARLEAEPENPHIEASLAEARGVRQHFVDQHSEVAEAMRGLRASLQADFKKGSGAPRHLLRGGYGFRDLVMDLGLLTAKFAPMLAPPQAQEIMALQDLLEKDAGRPSMSEAATQAVIDRLAYLFNNEVIPLLETRAGIERARTDLSHLGRGRFRGAGFLDWVKQKIASATQAATTVAKTVVERIGDVSRGVRRDYPPRVRELLARIGDKQIVAMAVRRDPIKGPLNTALNLITLGKWNEVRTRYNYDKLFHLGLEVVLDMGETEARFTVEKNEVINIGQAKATNADTEYQSVPRTVANLNVLLGKAREVMGDRFFLYDAFQNNCQDFVMNVLRANGLLTGELERFIKQPMVQVAAALPSYTSKIAKFATDAGALVNVAVEGRGMKGGMRKRKAEGPAPGAPAAQRRLVEAESESESDSDDSTLSEASMDSGESELSTYRRRSRRRPYPAAQTLEGSRAANARVEGLARMAASYMFPEPTAEKRAYIEGQMASVPVLPAIIQRAMAILALPGLRRDPIHGLYQEEEEEYEYVAAPAGRDPMRRPDDLPRPPPPPPPAVGSGRTPARFMKQLEKADVSPEAYLRLAKKKAAAKDLNAESLTFSSDGKHKLMIKDPEGGITHFGAIGYGDYILYTLSGDEAADAHRAAYRKRAENIKGKWRYDEYSPNSLAIHVLW